MVAVVPPTTTVEPAPYATRPREGPSLATESVALLSRSELSAPSTVSAAPAPTTATTAAAARKRVARRRVRVS
jgi:hypothetical protein